MTFKNVSFGDSPTMRSLERIAIKKGFFKDEPMVKTASEETLDLSVSNSLTNNLMKLCAGLRAKGLDSYAQEIEDRYVDFKIASVKAEVDEKIIQEAHPKSVKINDSVFHNVLETHQKFLDVVNKAPNGKISSASDILSAVKKALGQENLSSDKAALTAELMLLVGQAYTSIVQSINVADSQTRTGRGYSLTNVWNINIIKRIMKEPTYQNLKKAQQSVAEMSKEIQDELTTENSTFLGDILPGFNRADALLSQAINKRRELDLLLSAKFKEANSINDAMQVLSLLKSRVQSWLGRPLKPVAMKWVNDELNILMKIEEKLRTADKEQNYGLVPAIQTEIETERQEINGFYNDWKKFLG